MATTLRRMFEEHVFTNEQERKMIEQITPEASKELLDGNYERLAIHFASQHFVSGAIIDKLLQCNPESARKADGNGHLPLHFAARNNVLPHYGDIRRQLGGQTNASPAVVERLLKAYPDGVKYKDKLGKLPIHKAASNQASPRVIELLLQAYPAGARERDGSGDLPIDLARREGCCDEVLALLDSVTDVTPARSIEVVHTEESDNNMCQICFDAPNTHLFAPCGHQCACGDCGGIIMAQERAMCPVCRAPAIMFVQVFK